MLRIATDLTSDTVRLHAPTTTQFGVNISNLVWPNREVPWRPGAVVLLPLGRWREAVSGLPLIHFPANAAPLPTKTDVLPRMIRQEIIRLQPTGRGTNSEPLPAQVFIIGSISSNVVRAVRNLGFTTKRIRGNNSLETAAEVAREMARVIPNPSTLLVPYNSALDSQPVVGLSAHAGAPILFVNNDSVPNETSNTLTAIAPSAVYLTGRDSQISSSVANQIKSFLPKTRVIRIGGESITDFSINLARFKDTVNNFGWGRTKPEGDIFTFVSSGNIYYSIFAATLSHLSTHAPELIIPSDKPIPDELRDYLTDLNPPLGSPPRPPFMRGWIIGERKDISVQQQIELERLLMKEYGDWPPKK
ncbi:MAG: cell wall-binding repeat-containing protein [Syntrophomonadaceae bacterium]